MKNIIQRKQTSFRLRTDLIDSLKKVAQRENRTFNNYVEYVRLKVVYTEPNDITIFAIEEANDPHHTNAAYYTVNELFNDLDNE